ncbi:MAG: hypothetical protein RO009_16110 [Pseudorhodoplanes sp.]|jgi:hypothetical protein|nr:hypothetical protein [Pseudorhodoplanes sp.]
MMTGGRLGDFTSVFQQVVGIQETWCQFDTAWRRILPPLPAAVFRGDPIPCGVRFGDRNGSFGESPGIAVLTIEQALVGTQMATSRPELPLHLIGKLRWDATFDSEGEQARLAADYPA